MLNSYHAINKAYIRRDGYTLFLSLFAELSVEKNPTRADKESNGKNGSGENIGLRAEGVTAQGGGDYAGQSAQRADEQPQRKADVRKPREITKEILGSSGYHKDDEKEHIPFG